MKPRAAPMPLTLCADQGGAIDGASVAWSGDHQRGPDLQLDTAAQPQPGGAMGLDHPRRLPVEQAGQDRGAARREVAGEVPRDLAQGTPSPLMPTGGSQALSPAMTGVER